MRVRTSRFALALSLLTLPLMGAGCGPIVVGGGGGEDPPGPGGPGAPPGGGTAPSCGAELHVFGVYETHSNHSGGSHPAGAATVHVERQGSHVLALSSYEPVHWTITAEPGVVIEKIILNGYHGQTAAAPSGVPVEAYDYEVHGNWLGAYAYAWPGSSGGSDTQALVGTLEQLAGRGMTSFHGCYQGTSYVLHDDLSATVACTEGQGDLTSHVNEPECDDPPPPPPVSGCDGASGLGEYKGWYCDLGYEFIITPQLSCAEALSNCQLNAGLNPGMSFYCTWNGQFIHEQEVTPGACDWLSAP